METDAAIPMESPPSTLEVLTACWPETFLVAVGENAAWLRPLAKWFASPNIRIVIAGCLACRYVILPAAWTSTSPKMAWRFIRSDRFGVDLVSCPTCLVSFNTDLILVSGISRGRRINRHDHVRAAPVHSAIWFAVSMFGIAGLFILQGCSIPRSRDDSRLHRSDCVDVPVSAGACPT